MYLNIGIKNKFNANIETSDLKWKISMLIKYTYESIL